MSGEGGPLPADRHDAYRFDKRPGDLDVSPRDGFDAFARTLEAHPNLLTREKPFAIAGHRTCDGWRGQVSLADFQQRSLIQPLLTGAQMRLLAEELVRMANVFDDKVD